MRIVLPGCRSLKEKRSFVRSILDRSRRKFQVAAAEVGDLDIHGSTVLAFAAVSNERLQTEKVLRRLVSWLEAETGDQVVHIHLDYI